MIYSVNGVEQPAPDATTLGEFLERVRTRFNTETDLVSAIRVNGSELGPSGEAELGPLAPSQLERIDVVTAHPREVAEETLQSLLEFAPNLSSLSRACAELAPDPVELAKRFPSLLDGLDVFVDAITSAKRILRLGDYPRTAVLEADLLSIMKDLLACHETGEHAYLRALLEEHLPANLEAWRATGLPALIRSRDS
jgi:hypothetical protein